MLAYLGYGAGARAPRPEAVRGVIWVGWRQQRTETLIAAAILAAIAALLVPTGLAMASAYHHDGLAACARPEPRRALQQRDPRRSRSASSGSAASSPGSRSCRA